MTLQVTDRERRLEQALRDIVAVRLDTRKPLAVAVGQARIEMRGIAIDALTTSSTTPEPSGGGDPDEDEGDSHFVGVGQANEGGDLFLDEFVEGRQEDPRYDDHVQGHGTPPAGMGSGVSECAKGVLQVVGILAGMWVFFGGIGQLALGPQTDLWTFVWFGGAVVALEVAAVAIIIAGAIFLDWRDERAAAAGLVEQRSGRT